jgi:acetaldehyde dehydrogenase (acetylating)
MKLLKVAILGTGNIGTDLLLKLLKVDNVLIVAFVGRNNQSETLKLAQLKNIKTSTDSIDFFIQNPNCCDIVFDCTNANDAKKHADVFAKQSIKVIDLTPAKIGKYYVPYVSGNLLKSENNINMITCGGQSSIPLLYIISKHVNNIEYIEVVSQIASNSAGMATRINIDNYIETTSDAITHFTGCKNSKVILNLNPAIPHVNMQTTLFIVANIKNIASLTASIIEGVKKIKKYIPYFELAYTPTINENNVLVVSVKVKGAGDYLPEYAGNLDIINCAAIEAIKNL